MIEKYGVEFEEYGKKSDNEKVSIICLTYNHISYIKRTLDGFLMQRTTFPIKVFVYDDASTDGTSDIVAEYASMYPDIFYAVVAKKNTYNLKERESIFYELVQENMNGKYSAWCEGDDYWLYEYKLQCQYDFMEKNPEVSICVHNAIRYNAGKNEVVPQILNMDSGYESEDEIFSCLHGRIPTASYFWKSNLVDFNADFFKICPVTDEPLRIWLGYKGKVYYMDKVWSVRNYLHENSWNYMMQVDKKKKKKHNSRYLNYLRMIDELTEQKFHEQIAQSCFDFCKSELDLTFHDEMHEDELSKKVSELKIEYNNYFNKEFDDAFTILKRKCTETLDFLRKISNDKSKYLYIYGAGIQGREAIKLFEENQIKIDGIVVSKGGNGKEGVYSVIELNEVCEKPESKYFYLALRKKYRDEVIKILKEKGINNIL